MTKPILTYIISWPHAMAMIKKMNVRKHRNAGYHFELNDLGDMELYDNGMPDGKIFAQYSTNTRILLLRIYYEKPNESKITNKDCITNRIAS